MNLVAPRIHTCTRKMKSLTTASIVVSFDGSDPFELLTYDPNRITFDSSDVLGLTVQQALDKARVKAAFLMQESAVHPMVAC